MTKQEKLDLLASAYTVKAVADERGEIIVMNEESPLYEDIKRIQYALNDKTGTFELDYSMMRDACYAITDVEADLLAHTDANELAGDTASVYTATRLSYLNINNEAEVSDIINEYDGITVSEACAEWYERYVSTAIEMLIEWILEDEAV